MREYLMNFWKEFEYPDEDAEYLLRIYDQIMSNQETEKDWNALLDCYGQNIQYPWQALIDGADPIADAVKVHRYTVHLLLAQCLSRRLRAEYERQGLSQEMYRNAMLDIRYKLEECKLVRGIVGTFVFDWFHRFFDVTRFAIGRLQFELIPFGKSYEKDGLILTPESVVINVHIPRTCTPLNEKSCDEAFNGAKNFYRMRGEIGDRCVFYCSSWLLYPENRSILSPKSNVYKFMERFDVFDYKITPNGNDLWRLFDTDEKNPDRLPADTFMRCAYIQHLKNGGRTGSGRGVYLYND